MQKGIRETLDYDIKNGQDDSYATFWLFSLIYGYRQSLACADLMVMSFTYSKALWVDTNLWDSSRFLLPPLIFCRERGCLIIYIELIWKSMVRLIPINESSNIWLFEQSISEEAPILRFVPFRDMPPNTARDISNRPIIISITLLVPSVIVIGYRMI